MENPFRRLRYIFSVKAAADAGWNYQAPPPKLSPNRKKELMETSSLETPRSTFRSILGIMAPYWTKASTTERAIGAGLLASSLFMTWYAVQVTVEFGSWQNQLMNTVQQLFSAMVANREAAIDGVIGNYPLIQSAMDSNPLLSQIIHTYPDTTSILNKPEFQEFIGNNPEWRELLTSNPTLENIIQKFPGVSQQITDHSSFASQASGFKNDLGKTLSDMPQVKAQISNLFTLCGADFLKNWSEAFTNFTQEAFAKAWNSKDLVNIALKFTGMSIISFKSAQYLALRWRGWTTGYYTNKWLSSKAYSRLKTVFNNIDHPDQRIQEDPEKFTAGAVSLMTGVMSSGMTLFSFSGMLWGMGDFNLANVGGPDMNVPGAMFWVAAVYASTLTALTMAAGYKLPGIQRDQQSREAGFRSTLKKIHSNTDQIAQNNSEHIEKELTHRSFVPVIRNSIRDIGTQTKLILVDATAGNLSIPIPWVVGSFAIAAGAASMGTIQQLNYAFNRVQSSLSFIVNRFNQLSQMKATADRIYLMDQAIDASHYVEAEKLQLGNVQKIPKIKPTMAGA